MHPTAFDLANDHEFRALLGYSTPPLPARITAVGADPSAPGAYTCESLVGDVDITASALNGYTYNASDVVYLLLAAGSNDNAVILGTIHTADQTLHVGNPDPPACIFSARGSIGRFFLFDGLVTTTETTLIDAGQIGRYLRARVIASDATSANNSTPTLSVPSSSYNTASLTVGAATVQLRLYADGSLTAIVSSGSGAYSLVGWALSTD